MFELYQLRYFLAVVETGSFTKAAERACVTQPTLSAGIKKLESGLRVKLFNRSNRRIFLTEAGTQFIERAKSILHQCTLAEVELHEIEAPRVIRLGVLMTIPAARLAALAGGFRRTEPGVVIELSEGTEQEITNKLDSGGVDLALTILRGPQTAATPHRPPVELWEEGYVLALAASHPLAERGRIEGRALANEPTIVRTRCELLSETSRYFTDQNVRPRLVYRTPQDERALMMVAADLGFTTLPESYGLPGIAKLRLEGYDYRRRIGLLHGAPQWNKEKQALVDRFVAFAKAQH
ncbi:LysR family transcriptional regulator [Govanella unica]|uniref:LysR family transcriptional regulator n=1 Tax=Govanella unica TaxID=2975056 RepID=A0A9X3Z5Y1_9PROT|nr:LysR family transcriptional regulator [Govania unica]MDA5192571.1 LysR family transcriptional regulator [Govania unica]